MNKVNHSGSWWQIILASAVVSLIVSFAFLALVGGLNGGFSPAEQTATARQAVNSSSGTSSPAVTVAAEASPSVVSIVVTKDVPVIERYFQPGPFGLQIPYNWRGEVQQQEVAGGSGFFVSEEGLLVTNRHVASDPDASYTALTNDGETHELTVVGRDPFLDVAILKTKEEGDFQPLTFGDSDKLKLGQTVVAIGNALGELRNSVSVGVVSGRSRSVIAGSTMGNLERLEKVIQTDAAVNPGNSGGPLLNLSGEVVGVNVAIASQSENISFALPSNSVKQVVDSVLEHGEIVRPFLGVRYIDITETVAEQRNLPVSEGALVIEGPEGQAAVTEGSAAAAAGLRAGDIIISLAGQQISQDRSLSQIIRQQEAGDTVSIEFWRNGERLEVRTTLTRAPERLE